MSKELIERFPEINYSNYDHDDVHVLQNWALEAIDELTKQAEYKRKAEIWDYLYEAIEHTSRLSDELPDGTAGSSKEDIVNASLDVWREQQKKILALEGHIAKQAEQFQLFFEIADYAGFDIEERELSELPQAVAKLNERIAKQADQIKKLRTRLSAQMHQTQITAQQIHDAVLAAIKRGTTFPDGIDEQGHPIEQLVGMIVTTLQLKLDEQAERVKALEEYRNTNEDLIGTLLDSLEKIESHFSDKGELEGEGKWRLDSIYKAVQQANEAVDKCVAARKQSQLAAVLNDSTGGKQ